MYSRGHTVLDEAKHKDFGKRFLRLSEGPTWHEVLHLQRECGLARPRWTSQANLHAREPVKRAISTVRSMHAPLQQAPHADV